VRCASCGHSWFARLADDSETVLTESIGGLTREQVERLRMAAQAGAVARQGPHAEFRAREMARRARQRRTAVMGVWGAAGGLLSVSLLGAVLLRDEIARLLPEAASVYRLVGLTANRFGLELENVDARRSFDGTTPVIMVSGEAVNPGVKDRPAPDIRIELLDEAGRTIEVVTDALAEPAVAAGSRASFAYRITAPPLETYGLELSFSEAARAAAAPAAPETLGAHDGEAHDF